MINVLVKMSINLLKVEIWSSFQDSKEDDFIHYLKKGQPCEAGKQKLNSQLSVLVYESDTVNPFISPSDEEDANEEMNVITDETDEKIIM